MEDPEMDYSHDDIVAKIATLEEKIDGKQDKLPASVLTTLFVLFISQIFAYGVLYNKVDVAMNNRYSSQDAVRDMALTEARFERAELDIQKLEDVDEAFRERIRELEQRTQ